MQHTFTDAEVQHDPDGEPYAVEPTDEALHAIEVELEQCLSANYGIENIEISTDSDLIMRDPRRDADIG